MGNQTKSNQNKYNKENIQKTQKKKKERDREKMPLAKENKHEEYVLEKGKFIY